MGNAGVVATAVEGEDFTAEEAVDFMEAAGSMEAVDLEAEDFTGAWVSTAGDATRMVACATGIAAE